ncbi:phosphotransferase family protein [Paenibacillus glycinis]|uniref:Phosphotransferase n=1 Tax=Paenibacillus glycinis TaxID=2697035 RepID=A0ABW9XR63_9BACL|nr:aminoglycoside phosphotransferase family protein [Paenibacillus glycinis]NBD24852.1 phosphotransferase [Paenibacillus glycinis]
MGDAVIEQAERIAGDFLQEPVRASFQILGKGFVNQVCVVETDRRKVVVRMNDASAYPAYAKEKWCIEQAAAVGIPGPAVLSIGIVGDTAYMIQSYIDGDNGLDSKAPKADIWRRLGQYAKRIHAIPVKGFGENLADPAQGEFRSPPHAGSDGSWQGYVQYNIDCLTERDPLIRLGVLDEASSRNVRRRFERLKKETYRFGLIHGDLSLKNTIVSGAGEVRLLDWGNAEVRTVPHGDLMRVMQGRFLDGDPSPEAFMAFLDGYGGMGEDDLAAARELLVLRSFDNLRWALDRSPDRIESYAAIAKHALGLVMDPGHAD